MFAIDMPRGDIRPVCFLVVDANDQNVDLDEIYFTVKTASTKDDYLFQKRLSTGEIELLEDGSYCLTIEPEDTDSLKYGKYITDIEVLSGVDIKQTFVGALTLLDEVTHARNEAT